jgi:integrative and conjugative element protein (TIGR02256 family)
LSGVRGEQLTAWVTGEALESMQAEAQRRSPLETGGILMGYWAENLSCVVIASIVGPGPEAVHKRLSFTPDHVYQEREIERLYFDSGRRVTYLGDWHSHPLGPLRLSVADRLTQLRIGMHRKARAPRALMAILAGGRPWSLGVWQLERRKWWRSGSTALDVVTFSDLSDFK